MLGKGVEGLIFSVPVFQDPSCSPCSFILGAPHCILRNLCVSWCNLRRQCKPAWMGNPQERCIWSPISSQLQLSILLSKMAVLLLSLHPPSHPTLRLNQGLLHQHPTHMTDLRTYLPQAPCSYPRGNEGQSRLLFSLVTDESTWCNSPGKWQPSPAPGSQDPARPCLLSAGHRGVLLWDFASDT